MIESKNMLRMPFFVYNADEKSTLFFVSKRAALDFFRNFAAIQQAQVLS